MNSVIKIENLSKQYRLGVVGTGSLTHDLSRWWAKVRGKEDPYLKIGETNDRSKKGISDYVWALKDINFEVKQGEVLGIIGKNGAGKSTLLKLLSRVTAPTVGEIKIKGRIASLLEVGTGFHPELTGRENIFLNGAILGMTKAEVQKKLDEIVDFSGVERYIDTPVKRYSSGMYVRLAFAVAAHLEPEILIVDEVLAVGDAEFQSKCIGKMQAVAGQDRTVLFVSHNMVSVKSLCNRGIVLETGRVAYDGNVDDAVSFYLNSLGEKNQIPILDRTDIEGNRKLDIVDCYLIDDAGNRTTELISGLSGKIVFDYERREEIAAKRLFMGITFFDENDSLLSVVATDELGYSFSELKDKGSFAIEFNKLNLRAGRYHYNIFISEKMNNSAQHQKVFVLSNARELVVAPGDYWGTGNINRPKGFILDAKIKG